MQSFLLETAARVQHAAAINDTTFWDSLLVVAEITQLPSADQDPAVTGRSTMLFS